MRDGRDVEEGLAWEKSAFGGELEKIQHQKDAECLDAQIQSNRGGAFHASLFVTGIIDAHRRMLRSIAEARVSLRRRIVGTVPALGSPEALESLEDEITRFVDTNWKNVPTLVMRWVGTAFTPQMVNDLLASRYAFVPSTINAVVKRDLTTLGHEVNLGMASSAPAKSGPPPAPSPASRDSAADRQYEKDVFIAHASEDKETVARPVADGLTGRGLQVWFDEYVLTIGDRLLAKIDEGLRISRFGVVILSHSFFDKDWPQRELDGLVALTEPGKKKILPVWHGLDKENVARYSPSLAGVYAARTSKGIESVVDEILKAVRQEKKRQEPPASAPGAIQPHGLFPMAPPREAKLDKHPGEVIRRGGFRYMLPAVFQGWVTIAIEGPFESHAGHGRQVGSSHG